RERFGFAQGASDIERRLLPDRRRQRLSHQGTKTFGADALQHRRDVAGRGADMAPHEISGGLVGGVLERRVHECSSLFPISLRHPRDGWYPVRREVYGFIEMT